MWPGEATGGQAFSLLKLVIMAFVSNPQGCQEVGTSRNFCMPMAPLW